VPSHWASLQKWLGTIPLEAWPEAVRAGERPRRTRPVRILLVEKNPQDAELLEAILRRAGGDPIEVTRVERLGEACARLQQEPFDLVLLDLGLPDSSGLHTVEQAHAAAPAVPILVLAGAGTESLAVEAILLGAQYYVLKSELNPPLLLRTIRYALGPNDPGEKPRMLTLRDELTSLLNLRGFAILAEQQLKVARRYGQPLLLLLFDVDDCKQINARLGFAEGSRVLVETAALLRGTLRASDILARLGDDDFAALIPTGSAGNATALLERFRAQLTAWNGRRDRGLNLSVSVGVAPFNPEKPCSLHELLARADRQMRQAKKKTSGEDPSLLAANR
jgi:diguanylate cyclase (GGDEF)-like protein